MDEKEYPFLNESEPVQAEVVPEQPTVEVTPEPEIPAPAAPTAAVREETHVPLPALKAEREKRQAAERRIAELEAAQRQPVEQPDFYADPTQFIAQREQQLTQRMHAALEEQAREAYPDYDDVLAGLKEYAQENPAVIAEVFNAANPALKAYKLGKQISELKAMKDPGAYRAQIEAEVRAKIKAEQEAAEKARAATVAAIPPDLASARSAKDAEVAEELSLDSILASRKRR